MEAVVFIGVQATGKSSFYAQRFAETHLRLNMDMLRTRHRESLLLDACIASKTSFVVDNTNPTRADRERYVGPSKAAKYRVVGYYFASSIETALERNAAREGKHRIPDVGVQGTYNKLELPSMQEGFDELFYVQLEEGPPLAAHNSFTVQEWSDEVR